MKSQRMILALENSPMDISGTVTQTLKTLHRVTGELDALAGENQRLKNLLQLRTLEQALSQAAFVYRLKQRMLVTISFRRWRAVITQICTQEKSLVVLDSLVFRNEYQRLRHFWYRLKFFLKASRLQDRLKGRLNHGWSLIQQEQESVQLLHQRLLCGNAVSILTRIIFRFSWRRWRLFHTNWLRSTKCARHIIICLQRKCRSQLTQAWHQWHLWKNVSELLGHIDQSSRRTALLLRAMGLRERKIQDA